MKLIIDYDMLEKIRHSKEGIKASKYFWKSLKAFKEVHIFNLVTIIINIIFSIIAKKNKQQYIVPVIFGISIYSLGYKISKYFAKKDENNEKNIATHDLELLTASLHDLEIRTTTDLLKESKLNQVNYKITFRDDDVMMCRLVMDIKKLYYKSTFLVIKAMKKTKEIFALVI